MGVETGNSIRKDAKARAGLDLTISAPKSVTLQALVGGDERVIAAHDKAVSETLDFVDRKSTRLNSSHVAISYAVFCLNRKTAPPRLSCSAALAAGEGTPS